MNNLDKLRVLLPHWIEHNRGHSKEYAHWAQLFTDSGQREIAELLKKAETALESADTALNEALEKAGGALEGHKHDHHQNVPE